MVNASRATTNTLLIAKTTYRLYEPAGSFGTVGQHWGAVDRFVDELRPGKSLRRVTKDGTYRATIPDGGAIRVQTLVGALGPGEKIPKEPESRPVPAPSPGR
jgi:hypothetical protein